MVVLPSSRFALLCRTSNYVIFGSGSHSLKCTNRRCYVTIKTAAHLSCAFAERCISIGNYEEHALGVATSARKSKIMLIASLFVTAISSAAVSSNAKCDEAYDGDLPNFGSGSDPFLNGSYGLNEDETKTIFLSKVSDSKAVESSDLEKSVRAFENSIQSGKKNVHVLSTSKVRPENNDGASTTSDMPEIPGSACVVTKKSYFYKTSQIESKKKSKFVLLTGPSSEALGLDIAHLLGWDLNRMIVGKFNDGETKVEIGDSVRGKHIYLVCSTSSDDAVLELAFMISTLRRSSVKSITAVLPYFGYSRQDQQFGREPVAASDVANMYQEMGVDHLICLDLHNDTLRGFFKPSVPVENLMPVPVAAAYFNEEFGVSDMNITVVASHEGQVLRAEIFRNALHQLSGKNPDFAFITKNRQRRGETKYVPEVVGNVKGRRCIIVDDLVNTATTLESNVEKLATLGAQNIHALATHGVFGPTALCGARKRISNMKDLDYLLISNSIVNRGALSGNKIRQLNVAPLLAEAIARSFHNQSVSSILKLDKVVTAERYDG